MGSRNSEETVYLLRGIFGSLMGRKIPGRNDDTLDIFAFIVPRSRRSSAAEYNSLFLLRVSDAAIGAKIHCNSERLLRVSRGNPTVPAVTFQDMSKIALMSA